MNLPPLHGGYRARPAPADAMGRADVTETCGCGATLHVVMATSGEAFTLAQSWRRDHRHEPAPPPAVEPEHHDSTLDAYVEHSDHRDANPAAELDHRTRMGFRS